MPLQSSPFTFVAGQTLTSDYPLPPVAGRGHPGVSRGKHTKHCMLVSENPCSETVLQESSPHVGLDKMRLLLEVQLEGEA